jgi:cytochrome c oxidase subunit 2
MGPAPSEGYVFPADKLGAHIIPATPYPSSLTFNEGLLGTADAQRGFETYSRSACIGCHKIRGNPSSMGIIGPDLTHVASRHTIAGGLFPNDAQHLARWIKNARAMKPGSLMQTLGKGLQDPILKMTVTAGGLTDEQIADIVAYLRTLK